MAPIKNFNKQNTVLLSQACQQKQPDRPQKETSSQSAVKDIYTPGNRNPVAHDLALLKRHRNEMSRTKKRAPSQGGPGTFWDARANSKEMHKIADQQVDKNGAFSPQALLARGAAAFYDYSIAGPAQVCGETLGDPSSTALNKASSIGQVGLHLLDATPMPSSKIMKRIGNAGSITLSISGLKYK